MLIPKNKQNAEKYLMNVFKNMSKAETLNELRTWQKKLSNVLKLAPTSFVIDGHLKDAHTCYPFEYKTYI